RGRHRRGAASPALRLPPCAARTRDPRRRGAGVRLLRFDGDADVLRPPRLVSGRRLRRRGGCRAGDRPVALAHAAEAGSGPPILSGRALAGIPDRPCRVVREGGLEPPRPKTLEPKSSASADSATRACRVGHLTSPAPEPAQHTPVAWRPWRKRVGITGSA